MSSPRETPHGTGLGRTRLRLLVQMPNVDVVSTGHSRASPGPNAPAVGVLYFAHR